MPVLYNKVIDGPITNSKYIRFIKDCCVRVPQHKEYIGACVKIFKDEKVDEEKNFKLTVCDERGYKLVRLRIRGGLGGLTRTKYKVDNQTISRYDWRQGFWSVLRYIGRFFSGVGRMLRLTHSTANQIEWIENNFDADCDFEFN